MNAFKPAFRPAIRPAITSVFSVQVPPLTFTLQPQSKTVDEYSLATFSCEVTGGVAPYTYQWKKNGANAGADSFTLSFTAATADSGASIAVVVTDSAGTAITSNAATLGVTSYIYQFDGLTQYAQLSGYLNVPASTDFELEIEYTSLTGGYILADSASSNTTTGRYVIIGSDAYGYINSSGGSVIPAANMWVKRIAGVMSARNTVATATLNSQLLIDRILGRFGGATSFALAGGKVKTIKLWVGGDRSTGVLLNQIPLNNKSQGANQLATVGSVNATIVNYNAAGWTVI